MFTSPRRHYRIKKEHNDTGYPKIPKISPGVYIFKGPFEGLIFGGAYLRWEICVSKSIGLALQLEGNLPFLLCFTLYLRAFNKGFFALRVWGAYISRGLYMEGLTFGILRYVNLTRKQYLINLFLLLCSTKKITDKLLSKAWR